MKTEHGTRHCGFSVSLNGGFRVPAGRGSEDREHRKFFKGVCCKERLRNGTVSRGGCTGSQEFFVLNKSNYRMCAC